MTSPARAFLPPTPLRVVPPGGVDLVGAERAAAAFLTALGVATDAGATGDTPRRMARAYAEMLSPRSFDLTTFANDEDYDELVLAAASRCTRSVSTTCSRSWAPRTSGTYRGSGSWACPSGPTSRNHPR